MILKKVVLLHIFKRTQWKVHGIPIWFDELLLYRNCLATTKPIPASMSFLFCFIFKFILTSIEMQNIYFKKTPFILSNLISERWLSTCHPLLICNGKFYLHGLRTGSRWRNLLARFSPEPFHRMPERGEWNAHHSHFWASHEISRYLKVALRHQGISPLHSNHYQWNNKTLLFIINKRYRKRYYHLLLYNTGIRGIFCDFLLVFFFLHRQLSQKLFGLLHLLC